MFTFSAVVLLTIIYTAAQACIIGNFGRHLAREPDADDRRDFLEFVQINQTMLREDDTLLSASSRCNFLSLKQIIQAQRLNNALQIMSNSECRGTILSPEVKICNQEMALFSFTIPDYIFSDLPVYKLSLYVPSADMTHRDSHFSCLFTKTGGFSCSNFQRSERAKFVGDTRSCYVRDITHIIPCREQKIDVSVEFGCGSGEECEQLWLDGAPLLYAVKSTASPLRCTLC